MSSRARRATVLLVVILALAAAAAVLAFATRREPKTVTVERGSIEATLQTVGRLTPREIVAVRSEGSSQVRLVAVGVGDTVKAGDVLVELDPRPFRDAVQKAEQQVAAAESALNVAEQAGGANPSPQQLADRLTAEQNLRNARQALDQAKSAMAASLILAPANGTVLKVETAAGAPVSPGTEVAQVANLADLDLQVDLDEIDLPHVAAGQAVSFTLDAYPGQPIDGTLASISPVATTSGGTTTFQGTIQFTAPDALLLRPGMNADVSIKTAVRKDVLLVPESALRTVGQRTFVTVVAPDGSTHEREIKLGLRSNGMAEVASGLAEGDRVEVP